MSAMAKRSSKMEVLGQGGCISLWKGCERTHTADVQMRKVQECSHTKTYNGRMGECCRKAQNSVWSVWLTMAGWRGSWLCWEVTGARSCWAHRPLRVLLLLKGSREPWQVLTGVTSSDGLCQRITLATGREQEKAARYPGLVIFCEKEQLKYFFKKKQSEKLFSLPDKLRIHTHTHKQTNVSFAD